MDVRELYEKIDELMDKEVTLSGWVRNHRKQKEFGFIDFSDGTCFRHVQLVYTNELDSFDEIQKIKIGSSIEVVGMVSKSEGKGQEFEVTAYFISYMHYYIIHFTKKQYALFIFFIFIFYCFLFLKMI